MYDPTSELVKYAPDAANDYGARSYEDPVHRRHNGDKGSSSNAHEHRFRGEPRALAVKSHVWLSFPLTILRASSIVILPGECALPQWYFCTFSLVPSPLRS